MLKFEVYDSLSPDKLETKRNLKPEWKLYKVCNADEDKPQGRDSARGKRGQDLDTGPALNAPI
jgi:hypothetical protein